MQQHNTNQTAQPQNPLTYLYDSLSDEELDRICRFSLKAGEIWRPCVQLKEVPGGFSWYDSRDNAPILHGPFPLARDAYIDAIETEEVEDPASCGLIPVNVDIPVHDLSGLTYREAYDETQIRETIKDGHILNMGKGNIAILVQAWPVMVVGDAPFHQLGADTTWENLDDGKYLAAANRAKQIAVEARTEIPALTSEPAEKPALPVLNAFQKAVLQNYSDGVFAYICDVTTQEDLEQALEDSDDTLLTFLIKELATSEDCHSQDEALRRINVAIFDLQKAADSVYAIDCSATPDVSA